MRNIIDKIEELFYTNCLFNICAKLLILFFSVFIFTIFMFIKVSYEITSIEIGSTIAIIWAILLLNKNKIPSNYRYAYIVLYRILAISLIVVSLFEIYYLVEYIYEFRYILKQNIIRFYYFCVGILVQTLSLTYIGYAIKNYLKAKERIKCVDEMFSAGHKFENSYYYDIFEIYRNYFLDTLFNTGCKYKNLVNSDSWKKFTKYLDDGYCVSPTDFYYICLSIIEPKYYDYCNDRCVEIKADRFK